MHLNGECIEGDDSSELNTSHARDDPSFSTTHDILPIPSISGETFEESTRIPSLLESEILKSLGYEIYYEGVSPTESHCENSELVVSRESRLDACWKEPLNSMPRTTVSNCRV